MSKLAYVPFLIVSSAMFGVACGGTANQASTAGTGGSGASAGTQATTGSGGAGGTFTGQSYTIEFGQITVMPGEDHTSCVLVDLGNPDAMHVGAIHNVLTQGSHHLIVYQTNDTVEQKTPFDCQPFADLLKPDQGSAMMISQKKDDTLKLPSGVAFPVAAHQMIRLELHHFNASPDPIVVNATSTFEQMNDADVKNEAGFLFFGDPDINIPAHSSFTLGPKFIPLPAMLDGSKFFGFTGHEHQWGTDVTVAVTPSKDGADTPVYDVPNWLWSEPVTVYKDPPVVVPSGGGFHLTCTWNNESANVAKFGEKASDEMCFFWTYYYPTKGPFVCAHTDQVPGGYDLCCPGSPLCAEIFP